MNIFEAVISNIKNLFEAGLKNKDPMGVTLYNFVLDLIAGW